MFSLISASEEDKEESDNNKPVKRTGGYIRGNTIAHLRNICGMADQRRGVVSWTGHLGLCPKAVEEGDCIVAFPG